jgi:GTP-binding protein EngB required for normal cell division
MFTNNSPFFNFKATANWLNVKLNYAKESFLSTVDAVSSQLSPLQENLKQRLQLINENLNFSGRNDDRQKSDSSSGDPNPSIGAPHAADDDDDSKAGLQTDSRTDPVESGDEFMDLTRKLIEIRNILKAVKISGNLVLPSIVVIGSQSSGKSSVLEAIVGREFLPKGNNMVTRRPLELTLIHTPTGSEEYGEFPQLGLAKVTNFRHIQQTILELNLAVEDACVSDKPIELRIYSPNVPDLTLVDLPGYIQVHSRNQPGNLKEKIAALCDQYIKEPNLILAVCAADVDLANSEALRASRNADPMGFRTIGVLTKLDLIDPEFGAKLLISNDYPLHLGYVGVICGDRTNAIANKFDKNALIGIPVLRKVLMKTLEERMGSRMQNLADAVEHELAEASYQFKVMYNDRRVTSESYLAETMDTLKHRFKDFARQFGKPQVRQEVRAMLQARIIDICDQIYWSDPRIGEMTEVKAKEDPYWNHKLNLASSALTKSGIGRASTQLVVDSLMQHMERLVASDPFIHHHDTRRKVLMLANDIIRHKFHTTVDQVENTIKPYKFEVECTDQEWAEGTKRAVVMLEQEVANSQKAYDAIKATIGRRPLNRSVSYLSNIEKENNLQAAGQKPPADPSHDPILSAVPTVGDSRPNEFNEENLLKARTALFHRTRSEYLIRRLAHVKSRGCRSAANQAICPEIFLQCVSEKLAYTAVMFIYIELLNEFFFQFPRDVDERLYYELSKSEIATFAKENFGIRKQLELMERKTVLDVAQDRIRNLMRRQAELSQSKRSGSGTL